MVRGPDDRRLRKETLGKPGQLHLHPRHNHGLAREHAVHGIPRHGKARKAPHAETHVRDGIELRRHGAGAQRADVDAAAVAPQLLRQRFGQAKDIRLGGVIAGKQRPGLERRGGGDVQDVPGIPLFEVAVEQLREDMQRADVHVDHPELPVQIGLVERAENAEARVVDQDVDSVVPGLLIQAEAGGRVGKVGGQDADPGPELAFQLLQPLFPARGQDQLASARAQHARQVAAHPGARPRNQRLHSFAPSPSRCAASSV